MLFNKLVLALLSIVAVATALPTPNVAVERDLDEAALKRRQYCTPNGGE